MQGAAFIKICLVNTLRLYGEIQVLGVYLDALKVVWFAAMAFGASGFIAVAVEKHIPLRTNLETQYGLDTEDKREDVEGIDQKATS
jgi:hypothetical protein